MIWMPFARRQASSSLVPQRCPDGDFFLCGFLDALPKADLATMAHPVFPLSTKQDLPVLHCAQNEARIAGTPSVPRPATVFDKDILIYCNSQLIAAIKAGHVVGRILQLAAHDPLTGGNRETSGDGYQRLRNALERLAGPRMATNGVTGEREATTGFGLIEGWQIVRRTRGAVLTLGRDYFRPRKPLKRRVCELAHKHCGHQLDGRISIAPLCLTSWSASLLRAFRKMTRTMAASDHQSEDSLCKELGDILCVTRRDVVVPSGEGPPLRWPDADFLGWLRKRQREV